MSTGACQHNIEASVFNGSMLLVQQRWLEFRIKWNASCAQNTLHTPSSGSSVQSVARRILANGPCIAAGICETVHVFDHDYLRKVAGVSLSLRCFSYMFHAHLIGSIALCLFATALTVFGTSHAWHAMWQL